MLALFAPEADDEEDEDGLVDTSGLKEGVIEDGGVASGADSSAWTYTPDGEPPQP